MAAEHIVADVLPDGCQDLRLDAVYRLPGLVWVACRHVDLRVHLEDSRPGKVVQQRPVREPVLEPDESGGRREWYGIPERCLWNAPPGERFSEVPLMAGFPGDELPDEVELHGRHGAAE